MSRKSKNVQVKMEPLLANKLRHNAMVRESSVSEYVRGLIVDDLLHCGLISNEELKDIIVAGHES